MPEPTLANSLHIADAISTAAADATAKANDALAAAELDATAKVNAVLVHFDDSINNTTPNATIPVVAWIAISESTNTDLAITPKGSGALTTQVADNTVAGGNKRGLLSVDLQSSRSVATQVASGTASGILSGSQNTSAGINSLVAGGDQNNVGTNAGYSTISGGRLNSITFQWSAILGGYSNTVTNNYAFIGGGISNSVSGEHGAVCGGWNNTASGSRSFVGGGTDNVAVGNASVIPGGQFNAAVGDYSIATGRYATTRGLHGVAAHSANRFAVTGDAQRVSYMLRMSTTTATAAEASLDGGTAAAATRVVIPNNHAYKFTGQAIARQATTGDVKSWDIKGTIKRGANQASTTLVTVAATTNYEDAGAAAWTLTIDADTTNGSLRIQTTGEAAKTIRWVINIDTIEIG